MKNDNNEGEAAGGGYWSGGWGLAGVEGGDAVLGVRFENPHRGPLLSSIFIIWQVWHAATITGLSRAQRGFVSTQFAFGSVGDLGAHRAVSGGRLPYRVLDVSRRLAFLHGAAQYPTCPDQDVLDRAREDPDDEAGALAVRRPALFHPSSEARLGRASIHREPAL